MMIISTIMIVIVVAAKIQNPIIRLSTICIWCFYSKYVFLWKSRKIWPF